jgi:hypothetical protein
MKNSMKRQKQLVSKMRHIIHALADGDWKSSRKVARTIPIVHDILHEMASSKAYISPKEVAATVAENYPSDEVQVIHAITVALCKAAWGIESHALRIASGKERPFSATDEAQ